MATLAERSRRAVWHPCTQMKRLDDEPPLAIVRADGPWLHDDQGRRYLDAVSSWWVNLFGHNHPAMRDALVAQFERVDHVMLAGLTHEPVIELSVEPKTKRNKGSAKSRYIPRKILRKVHARDNGQCTFVSRDGLRCTERGFLQVHHHNTTFARGGEATADNLRFMCRAHNMFQAQQDYGREFMQNKLLEAAARKQLSLVPGQFEL